MAYLVVNPEHGTEVIRLEDETSIGRESSCDVRLDDRRVSRCHCRIVRTASGLFQLEDLQSVGGTHVNGVQITSLTLRTGDRIVLGQTELVFCHTRPSTASQPPTERTLEDTTHGPTGGLEEQLEELRRLLTRLEERHGGEGLSQAELAVSQAIGGSPLDLLTRQRNRLLEVMEINRALTTELDLGRLLEMILEHLVHLVDAEQAFLIMFDEAGEPRVEAYRNAADIELAEPLKEISRSILDRVREGGSLIHCHDAQGDSDLGSGRSVAKLKLRTILCLPLHDEGRVGGALYVENRVKRRAFDAAAVELIEAFGDQASIALRNARQRAKILKHNRNLDCLLQLSRAATSTLEISELPSLLVNKVMEVTSAERVALLLPNEDGNLEFAVGVDSQGNPLEAGALKLTSAIKRSLRQPGKPEKGRLVLPLIARAKEHLGVLFAEPDASGFDDQEQDLIEQLAETAALALYNARLFERATVDQLTGLYKRAYLDDRLIEEQRRAERYGSPLVLLMIDLDHFKHVNDTHGHLVGDDALRTVGALLRSALRETDIAARWGGEEFAVMLPQASPAEADAVAAKVRTLVETQTDFPHPLTCSVGLAEHEIGLPCQRLIERADAALYAAKHGGRNRVIRWPEELVDAGGPPATG